MNRYAKQLNLPEITPACQEKLARTKLLMIGEGGLGAAALPYLAGAGIGSITIVDHDAVDISNLHRQTIYREQDAGQNKARLAAAYIKNLNATINIHAIAEKLERHNAATICQGYDIILDGSDNFETKSLLNDISIQTKTPLISASVEGFTGMVGIFAGFAGDTPCYHCLYPELPLDACDCNDAGILGSVAGLAGLYQAHITLCFLLGIGDAVPGQILSIDFKNFRMNNLKLRKNPQCAICAEGKTIMNTPTPPRIAIIPPNELKAENCLIIDVRTYEEVAIDPIPGAIHMPLDTFAMRYAELPKDTLLAFACASNIRSAKAANFMAAQGYENLCVMDRLVK